ncbi:MAG: VanZ family protein [Planctomycetota bacterium]
MSRSAGLTWMWRALAVVYAAGLSVGTHWPRLDLGPNDLGYGLQLDKLLHAGAFGGLAVLAWWARPAGRRRGDAVNGWVVLIGVTAWAGLDEWTQQWFDRQIGWDDVLASWCGVWSAVLVFGPRPMAGWGGVAAATRGLALVAGPTALLFAVLPIGNAHTLAVMRMFGAAEVGVDRWLHFWGAAVSVWCLGGMALAGVTRPRVSAAIGIVAALAVAPVLEPVQHALGRAWRPDPIDVAWHLAGATVGIGAWAVLRAVRVSLPAGAAVERGGD